VPELQGTLDDISMHKCMRACDLSSKERWILVEDSALCFSALHGLPGPYIKHFLDALGCTGLWEMMRPHEDKSAQAKCVFTLYNPTLHSFLSFSGTTDGTIVEPRGDDGFGWDSIFEPIHSQKTYVA